MQLARGARGPGRLLLKRQVFVVKEVQVSGKDFLSALLFFFFGSREAERKLVVIGCCGVMLRRVECRE